MTRDHRLPIRHDKRIEVAHGSPHRCTPRHDRAPWFAMVVVALFLCSGADAATLTVTSANDVDDGACTTAHCSLREAITLGNELIGPDRIVFAIPAGTNAGVIEIHLQSGLPVVRGTSIDGFTQPLAQRNNAAFPALPTTRPGVRLVGAAGISTMLAVDGTVAERGITIQGIGVSGGLFGFNPIDSGFGIDVQGVGLVTLHGVQVENSDNLCIRVAAGASMRIGGGSVLDHCGNSLLEDDLGAPVTLAAIHLEGSATSAATTVIEDLFVTTDIRSRAAVRVDRPNALLRRVRFMSEDDRAFAVQFGPLADGCTMLDSRFGSEPDESTPFNTGVLLDSQVSRCMVGSTDFPNTFFVKAGAAGIRGDGRLNGLGFNRFRGPGTPIVSVASLASQEMRAVREGNLGPFRASGKLVGLAPGERYRIGFHADRALSSGGGLRHFLDRKTVEVEANASGEASFAADGLAFDPGLEDPAGLASISTISLVVERDPVEPSNGNATYFPGSAVVLPNTGDVLNVTTTGSAGAGSLADAIRLANAAVGHQQIHFSIPGAGPHRIVAAPQSLRITDSVTIDGFTQPGSAPNAQSVGNNATFAVEIEYPGLTSCQSDPDSDPAFVIDAPNVVLRGLAIAASGCSEVAVRGDAIGDLSTRIEGLWIGFRADGTRAGRGRVKVHTPTPITIGGALPSQRNVIASDLEVVDSPAALVEHNLIGLGPSPSPSNGSIADGALLLRNSSASVINNVIHSELVAVRIEDTTGSGFAENAIGHVPGHPSIVLPTGIGVFIERSADIVVEGDTGSYIQGLSPVVIGDSQRIRIGQHLAGPAPAVVIRGGNSEAVSIEQTFSLSGTSIGIDLRGAIGRDTNDPRDTDSGPNHLQNAPTITLADRQTDGNVRIALQLNSEPSSEFVIRTCAAFRTGAGCEQLIDEFALSTDGTGHVATESFVPLPAGAIEVVATASRRIAEGVEETGEPSLPVSVTGATDTTVFSDGFE